VLIVEILSPSNQAKTSANIWAYTCIPSVREILIRRADRSGAELLRRSTAGGWPERPTAILGGDLELPGIDFRVALAELYAGTGLAR
jgi:Uma2 family endonuclease